MNFLSDVSTWIASYGHHDLWNIIQAYASIGVIIGSLLQRSWVANFSTIKSPHVWASVKIGQLGLYMLMMMGILALIDSYFIQQIDVCHPFITLWCVAVAMKQASVFFWIFGKKTSAS